MSIKSTLSEKRIAIVCNPLAGIGKAVILTDKLAEALEKRAVDHHLFKNDWPKDWGGFTDIFIVGGDGTLNYFINQYPDVKLPLVVFNGGTGNDFHWMLYGNTTVEKQLDKVLEADAKPVDCGRCNDRLFLNGLGIGFEGKVAASLMGKQKRFGKKSFLLAILKKIILYRSKFYKITCAEKTIEGRHMMISIMNGKRAGGDFNISPESSPVDGLFNVVLVESLNVFKRFLYLPVIEKGRHLQLSFVDHFNTAYLTIECEEPIISHLDGEFYSAERMEVSILPGKFRFKY